MAVTINGTTGILAPDIGIDGTTLTVDAVNNRIGIATSSPNSKLQIVTDSGARALTVTAPTLGPYIVFETNTTPFADIGSEAGLVGSGSNTDMLTLNARGSRSLSFRTNSNERLRITSDGNINITGGNLQIGGTNILNSGRVLYNVEEIKLADTKELVLGSGNDLKIYHSGSHSFISEVGSGALKIKGDDIRFEDAGGTEALRINSYGTLGVGCVPNNIQDNFDAVQIGGNLVLNVDSTGVGAGVYMSNNVYRDRTNSRWEYINTDEATQYVQANGEHIWRYAASGSADSAITWSEALRITSDGLVGIGQVSPQGDLHIGNISGSKDIIMHSANNGNARVRFREGGSNTSGFNEYSIGMVGSGNKMTVNGQGAGEMITLMGDTGLVGIGTTNPQKQLHIKGTGSILRLETTATTGTNYLDFYDASARKGYIGYGSSGSETFFFVNEESDPFAFYTKDSGSSLSEKFRINSNGKVEINSNGSYGSNAKALNIGSRTSASYQGTLALARGEALGGGTGPYMELIHGPDGGTQRTHQIYSYVGDFRIYADAAENLEISGLETKIKDSSRSDVAIFNANGLEMEKNTARLFGRYVGKTNTASNYELTHWTASSFRILEVFGFINPNAAGSGVYYDPTHFYVYNATGWNGSSVSYYLGIKHVAPGARTYAPSGTGSDPTQNIVAKWGNNNSTATTNGGHYLKFEWSGANTSNNYQSYFRVIRRM